MKDSDPLGTRAEYERIKASGFSGMLPLASEIVRKEEDMDPWEALLSAYKREKERLAQ